jgi:seryl-tRNA synthetase
MTLCYVRSPSHRTGDDGGKGEGPKNPRNPMLDAKLIRNEPERVKEGARAKGHDEGDVDHWLDLDQKRRALVNQVERQKAERNAASKEIGAKMKAGEDASVDQERVRALGDEIKAADLELREIDVELETLTLAIPNIADSDVPRGGESENQVLRTWGEPVEHPFPARTHDDLGVALGLFDFESATRMSGPGFAVFKGTGAYLERALIQFMLELHVKEHGYTEVSAPFLVKPSAAQGTGQLPKLAEDMYRTDVDGFYLIPTAEVSITNMYSETVLAEEDLPLYHVGYSPCFRREAGSYGKETKGLTRIHQFDKVEMVKFVHPGRSEEELEMLLANAERVLQSLGLAYRAMLLASSDLSFAAAKCYDLEVWAPGSQRWLEVTSCSNFRDFQARRANIRYKPKGGGKTRFIHTLNGSGLALPRTVVALLETYQTEQGTIIIPEALRPYLGGLAEVQ